MLANSDNVIRAGLTGKHIDVPELLKLLDPAVTVPVLTPAPRGESCFIPAADGPLHAAGPARLFLASPGQ